MNMRVVYLAIILLGGALGLFAQTGSTIPNATVPESENLLQALAALKAMGFTPVIKPIPARDCWLSPGGKSYAFLAGTPDNTFMMINGKPSGPYQRIEWQKRGVVWSNDGSTLAMLVLKNSQAHGEVTLVINGEEKGTHRLISEVVLSSDGKRYAYAACNLDVYTVLYVDGREVGKYICVGEVGFTPDAKRAIWVAADQAPIAADKPGGYDVFVDGQKFKAHFRFSGRDVYDHGVGSLVISPDGKRWAVMGQVFGPDTPESGGVGGYAVMVDGKMEPTHEDVAYGTLQFSADSKDVLYVAGDRSKGHYAVYRNGLPGKEWNYIQPTSLRLIDGGKSVAFTGYEGTSNRFNAQDPTPGCKSWTPGTPALVIGDKVAVSRCIDWAVSDDGRHILAAQMEFAGPDPTARIKKAVLLDGKKVADVPEDEKSVEMRFSPDGSHWLVVVHDRFLQAPQLIVDGKRRTLPADSFLKQVAIDNTGRVTMQIDVAGAVCVMSSAAP